MLLADEGRDAGFDQPLAPWVMRKNISAPFTPVNTVYFHQVNVQ